MRLVVQRVARAEVRVGAEVIGAIGAGLAILVGFGPRDDEAATARLAKRVAELRIFEDGKGQTNLSLVDIGGAALVVSQFTLYADTRRGRRPGFAGAAAPALAERLYLRFADELRAFGIDVATGRFGSVMDVELVNRGPFTIWLDSDD